MRLGQILSGDGWRNFSAAFHRPPPERNEPAPSAAARARFSLTYAFELIGHC